MTAEVLVAARAGTVDQNLIPANAQNLYGVRKQDLPLSCPMPGMYLWNSHPKVYLPIEETGEAKCPYCGAEYSLADAGA
ncbi:MAG: zinc-finger domain-containing protein [Proteobacteria bacterium]|nr:zinc-finger domain-containing protein [Pseudomonadota bacterium]